MAITRYLALFLFGVQLFFSTSVFAADSIKVVTTIKPVHSLVSMLTEGTSIETQLLLPGEADPHFFSMRPTQVKMLKEANLVIYVHSHYERFLAKWAKKAPQKYLSLFDGPETNASKFQHGWLSPQYAEDVLRALPYHFKQRLPSFDTSLDENLFKAVEKIRSYKLRWQKELATGKGKTLWTDSEALYGFAEELGLKSKFLSAQSLLPIAGKTPGCIVVTHGKNPVAEKFSTQFDYPMVEVDLLGHAYPEGPLQYFQLMDALVKDISDCLA